MGVLNDFFIATDEELAALDTRSGPGRASVVDAKGILDVEWATLERLLHGESVDDVDAVVNLIQEPLRQEPADQPEALISRVNERLVVALADPDEAQLAAVVGPWLATEEMASSGWDEAAATRLLTYLGELCAGLAGRGERFIDGSRSSRERQPARKALRPLRCVPR